MLGYLLAVLWVAGISCVLALLGDGERPMIYFTSNCRDSIRTLPALQHDRNKPEDVDTESEDHAPDEIRYACMSRPYIKDVQKQEKGRILGVGPHNEVRLEDLWEKPNPQRRARVLKLPISGGSVRFHHPRGHYDRQYQPS